MIRLIWKNQEKETPAREEKIQKFQNCGRKFPQYLVKGYKKFISEPGLFKDCSSN